MILRLMKALGSAVVVGAGVKAGSDLYSAFRQKVGGDEATGSPAASSSPIDEILDSDDDTAAKTAKLKKERARIERELEQLKRRSKASR